MNQVARSYIVLGISPGASLPIVKQAYRKLAKKWHPDRYINDPILKAKAEAEIKKINQAYSIIKDSPAEGYTIRSDVTSKSPAKRASQTKVNRVQHTLEFYCQQGINYIETEEYDAALNSFAQALKLNPNYLEVYQCRGFILSKLGFNLRADAEFKKARQIKLKSTVSTPYSQQYTKYRDYAPTATEPNKSSAVFEYWHTIVGFEQPIKSLVISNDGEIASANGEAEINLWQVNTGKKVGILKGHTERVTCLAISCDGRILISGGQDKTIKFWDLQERKIIRTLDGYFDGHLGKITALALTPDNQTLISCSADNSLKIWDVDLALEIQHICFSSAVTSLAVSPDGQLFCSGGLESELNIRSTKNGQVVRSIDNQSEIFSLAFSPDGNLLATGGFDRDIKLWDLITGKEIYTLMGHKDRVSKVLFSKDGKTLLSSSWDRTIKLWKLSTGTEIISKEAHSDKINSIAIAPNNRVLVSGSADNTIKLWHCNL